MAVRYARPPLLVVTLVALGAALVAGMVSSAVGKVPSILSGLLALVGALIAATGIYLYFQRDCKPYRR